MFTLNINQKMTFNLKPVEPRHDTIPPGKKIAAVPKWELDTDIGSIDALPDGMSAVFSATKVGRGVITVTTPLIEKKDKYAKETTDKGWYGPKNYTQQANTKQANTKPVDAKTRSSNTADPCPPANTAHRAYEVGDTDKRTGFYAANGDFSRTAANGFYAANSTNTNAANTNTRRGFYAANGAYSAVAANGFFAADSANSFHEHAGLTGRPSTYEHAGLTANQVADERNAQVLTGSQVYSDRDPDVPAQRFAENPPVQTQDYHSPTVRASFEIEVLAEGSPVVPFGPMTVNGVTVTPTPVVQ